MCSIEQRVRLITCLAAKLRNLEPVSLVDPHTFRPRADVESELETWRLEFAGKHYSEVNISSLLRMDVIAFDPRQYWFYALGLLKYAVDHGRIREVASAMDICNPACSSVWEQVLACAPKDVGRVLCLFACLVDKLEPMESSALVADLWRERYLNPSL